jgi:hypothetical protein
LVYPQIDHPVWRKTRKSGRAAFLSSQHTCFVDARPNIPQGAPSMPTIGWGGGCIYQEASTDCRTRKRCLTVNRAKNAMSGSRLNRSYSTRSSTLIIKPQHWGQGSSELEVQEFQSAELFRYTAQRVLFHIFTKRWETGLSSMLYRVTMNSMDHLPIPGKTPPECSLQSQRSCSQHSIPQKKANQNERGL